MSRSPSEPSLSQIALAWAAITPAQLEAAIPNLRALWIGWGEPFCFACGHLPDVPDSATFPEEWIPDRRIRAAWNGATGLLERAHLHDLSQGGSCAPLNYAPLCIPCHAIQPICASRQAGLDHLNTIGSCSL